MDKLDLQEVQKRVDILNVAYHLCLEIVEEKGYEHKAICPFCGYNKNSKIISLITCTNVASEPDGRYVLTGILTEFISF